MYTNIFDTVRTGGADILSVQNVLYTSIISGLHPLLALNQAVDNIALIDLCQNHRELIDLIERNVIRVAPYKVFRDERGAVMDPIMGYMRNALNYPEEGSDRDPFIFSSLPFLDVPGKHGSQGVYDDQARRWIYLRMRDVISGNLRYFSSNLDAARNRPHMDPEHVDRIDQHLRTIRRIIDAAKGQYLPLRKNPPSHNTLSEKISHYTKIYTDEFYGRTEQAPVSVTEEYVLALIDLEARMQRGRTDKKNVNDRSTLYRMAEETCCRDDVLQELKEMVDLCYNEVVATSLNDNEEDVMVVSHGQANIELMMLHDDLDCMATGQKFLMMEKADNNIGELSWEKLSSILAQVQRQHPSKYAWKYRMEEALLEHEIKSMTVAGQKYATGVVKLAKSCFNYSDSIKEIVDNTCKNKPFENRGFFGNLQRGWQVILEGIELVEGGKEAKEIIAEGSKNRKDSQDYSKMQDLVTQTNYLKRDYAWEDDIQ